MIRILKVFGLDKKCLEAVCIPPARYPGQKYS
jgi:hypothetical protein